MKDVKLKKEDQKRLKGLSKAISILAKIGKVVVTIAAIVILLVMFIVPKFMNSINVSGDTIKFESGEEIINIVEEDDKVKVYHNDNILAESEAKEFSKIKNVLSNNSKGMLIFCLELELVFAIASLILMRFAFGYLVKLFNNINKEDTPFTKENVELLRKMGYLMIATFVLPFISGLICEIILHADLDISFGTINLLEILFLFSLAYIFEYGRQIQLDSKGKIYGEIDE